MKLPTEWRLGRFNRYRFAGVGMLNILVDVVFEKTCRSVE